MSAVTADDNATSLEEAIAEDVLTQAWASVLEEASAGQTLRVTPELTTLLLIREIRGLRNELRAALGLGAVVSGGPVSVEGVEDVADIARRFGTEAEQGPDEAVTVGDPSAETSRG